MRILLFSVATLLLASCVTQTLAPIPQTTFDRVRPLAVNGDSEFQNLVGFMLFHGEGVGRDLLEAHQWFHASAVNGHPTGQTNDAFLHRELHLDSNGIPSVKTAHKIRELRGEGESSFVIAKKSSQSVIELNNRIPRGELLYARFCAGCHGLNGIAAFLNSPSFALNERMEKSDEALFLSVSNGIREMPSWGGKLPHHELRDIIAYIRTLRNSYQVGVTLSLRDTPQYYLLFGPMIENHSAFQRK